MPSLSCLISALTQAGGGDLLFRFASSVLLRGGRGAADRYRFLWGAPAVFRPHWVCPAQGCLCFPVYTAQASSCPTWSGPCVECSSSFRVLHKSADLVAPAFCAFPGLSGSGSQGLDGCTRPRCSAPFPLRGPSTRRRSGLRKSSDRNRGRFAGWEGVASLGLSLPLSPSPASFLQWGWGGSSLEFLSPFVLQTAGGVFGRLIFPCSSTV